MLPENEQLPFAFYRIPLNLNKILQAFYVSRSVESQILRQMKTILLLLTVIFTTMAVTGCTNDEGEDLDVLTPNEEEEQLVKESVEIDGNN